MRVMATTSSMVKHTCLPCYNTQRNWHREFIKGAQNATYRLDYRHKELRGILDIGAARIIAGAVFIHDLLLRQVAAASAVGRCGNRVGIHQRQALVVVGGRHRGLM